MMSKLYDSVTNPLCIKGCDAGRLTALTLIWNKEGGDYYKFTFNILTSNGNGELKDTAELIDWLNKTPQKEFYIVAFPQVWSIYLHEDDALLWKIRWNWG